MYGFLSPKVTTSCGSILVASTRWIKGTWISSTHPGEALPVSTYPPPKQPPSPVRFLLRRHACHRRCSLRGLTKLVNLMELYCGNNDITAASEVTPLLHGKNSRPTFLGSGPLSTGGDTFCRRCLVFVFCLGLKCSCRHRMLFASVAPLEVRQSARTVKGRGS